MWCYKCTNKNFTGNFNFIWEILVLLLSGGVSISQLGLRTAVSNATADHLTLNGGTLESTADFTLDSNRGISLDGNGHGTINVDGSTTLTYDGIIAGSNNLTKSGTGKFL